MAPKYSNKLTGKRILVIGGTSGIGFCVAEACVEFGAIVTVASSRQEKIDNTIKRLTTSYPDAKGRISGHVVDLASSDVEAVLTTLFNSATAEGEHKLDHIVNTAGDALSLMIAKLAPRYIHRSSASSITVTGGISSTKPLPGWSVQVGWGAGKEGMVRGLAVDLAPLRVNLVSPGAIDTEFFDRMAGGDAGSKEKLVALYGSKNLLGKCGSPEDTAEAYLYVMRDTFVTGQVVRTEGGYLLV